MATFCPDKRGPALYLDCRECTEKHCELFFCLVAGTRTFNDYELLKKKLDHLLKNHAPHVAIVSGEAHGADMLAKRYAQERGYTYYGFPADWNAYGKGAGYIRNRQMHEFISGFPKRAVAAFWDGKSKGTAHNFDLAEKYNTQLAVIRY